MTNLERASHISVILVCALTVYVLIRPPFHGPADGGRPAGSQLLGKPLRLAGATWPASQNLVIAMTTSGHFCQASLPFYQRLQQAVKDSGAAASLQFVAPDPVDVTKDFLVSHRVEIPRVIRAPLNSIGVFGTPTLMVTDGNGIIRHIFLGQLDQKQENEVLALVRPATGRQQGGPKASRDLSDLRTYSAVVGGQ